MLGLSVTYLPAGTPFQFFHEHSGHVMNLFSVPLTISKVPLKQCTLEVILPEDRVLLTWHEELSQNDSMHFIQDDTPSEPVCTDSVKNGNPLNRGDAALR